MMEPLAHGRSSRPGHRPSTGLRCLLALCAGLGIALALPIEAEAQFRTAPGMGGGGMGVGRGDMGPSYPGGGHGGGLGRPGGLGGGGFGGGLGRLPLGRVPGIFVPGPDYGPIRPRPPIETVEDDVYEPPPRRPRPPDADEPRPRRPRPVIERPRVAEPPPIRRPPVIVEKPVAATHPAPKTPPTKTRVAKPEPSPQPRAVKAAKAPPPPAPPLRRPPPSPPPVAAPNPVAQAPVADEPGVVPGEVLFELRNDAPARTLADIARRERLAPIASERFTLVPMTLHRYRTRDRRSVAAVVRALGADPRVASVQPNHAFALVGGATPAFAGAQYVVAKLQFGEAHRTATGRDVPVAVIDSGVDAGHPALKGAVAESYDAIEARAGAAAGSAHAHGTAIAGIIGSRAQLASAAPDARLLTIRAFSGEASPKPSGAQGTTIHILRGLDWAARTGARVVNMSFAGPRDAKLSQFLAGGVARGAIYVAASGNAGPDSGPLYPAADGNVIAVTATDAEDRLFPAANRGAHICVAAPGVEIFVAAPGGAYGFSSGTSMAAAQVSGIVALMLQAKPDLTPIAVRAALTRSAADLGPPGIDDGFGAGFTDARSALRAVGGEAVPALVSDAKPLPAEPPASVEAKAEPVSAGTGMAAPTLSQSPAAESGTPP